MFHDATDNAIRFVASVEVVGIPLTATAGAGGFEPKGGHGLCHPNCHPTAKDEGG
jgi:hypothetical protein